jgi:hypothetical protein
MAARIYMSVGDVAERMGIEPRVISDLLYTRKLSIDRCPVVAGRRLIPCDYLPKIERVLRSQKEDANSCSLGVMRAWRATTSRRCRTAMYFLTAPSWRMAKGCHCTALSAKVEPGRKAELQRPGRNRRRVCWRRRSRANRRERDASLRTGRKFIETWQWLPKVYSLRWDK